MTRCRERMNRLEKLRLYVSQKSQLYVLEGHIATGGWGGGGGGGEEGSMQPPSVPEVRCNSITLK